MEDSFYALNISTVITTKNAKRTQQREKFWLHTQWIGTNVFHTTWWCLPSVWIHVESLDSSVLPQKSLWDRTYRILWKPNCRKHANIIFIYTSFVMVLWGIMGISRKLGARRVRKNDSSIQKPHYVLGKTSITLNDHHGTRGTSGC